LGVGKTNLPKKYRSCGVVSVAIPLRYLVYAITLCDHRGWGLSSGSGLASRPRRSTQTWQAAQEKSARPFVLSKLCWLFTL